MISMPIEISGLKIFLAVAKKGSISKAAEELHYVQSNVTIRIKQLEETLGTALFYRKSRGVSLTGSGYLLRDYAEKIIAMVSEAEKVVSNPETTAGQLIIGSMETTAAIRLPPLLAAYHRSYPQVELNLITGTSEESLTRLLDHQIEGAFVAGIVSHKDLIAEKAYEEELVLAAPTNNDPFSQREGFKVLVFRAGCAYRAHLENWLRTSGRVPYQMMEFGSIEGILGCVAAGMGISFLPRSVVDSSRVQENISIHNLPTEIANMTTWFVRRKNEKQGHNLKLFRELIVCEEAGKEDLATTQ